MHVIIIGTKDPSSSLPEEMKQYYGSILHYPRSFNFATIAAILEKHSIALHRESA
jgi:hypothetical protein